MNIATAVEILCWIIFLLISVLLIRQARQLFVSSRFPLPDNKEVPPGTENRRQELRIFITVVVMVVFSRAVIFGVAYLASQPTCGFWEALPRLWDRWDSRHYLFLAEHAYRTQLGREWVASFAPLFPFVIKIFHLFIPDYFIAALVVSHLGLIAGAYFLYKLVLLDYDEAVAFRALTYVLIYPFSFFLNIAFSEGLFFAFAITTFYFLRKEKYGQAGALSVCGMMTRFVWAPFFLAFFFAEYISDRRIIEIFRRKDWRAWGKDMLRRGAFLAWLGCGILHHFLFHKINFGSGLAYFHYQKSFWFHHLLFFPENLKLMITIMPRYTLEHNASLWGSEVGLFFVLVVLLFLGMRRMRFSYNFLFFVYLFGIYSTYWLLSAGRYFAGFFPVALVLALLSKNRTSDVFLTLSQIILLFFYAILFTRGTHLM